MSFFFDVNVCCPTYESIFSKNSSYPQKNRYGFVVDSISIRYGLSASKFAIGIQTTELIKMNQKLTPATLTTKRVELGLSNPQLAAKLGVTVGTVYAWLKGRSPIPDTLQARLAAIAPGRQAGRPKKQTFGIYVDSLHEWAFWFNASGTPMPHEGKSKLRPGALFWKGTSTTDMYIGGLQHEYIVAKARATNGSGYCSYRTGRQRSCVILEDEAGAMHCEIANAE